MISVSPDDLLTCMKSLSLPQSLVSFQRFRVRYMIARWRLVFHFRDLCLLPQFWSFGLTSLFVCPRCTPRFLTLGVCTPQRNNTVIHHVRSPSTKFYPLFDTFWTHKEWKRTFSASGTSCSGKIFVNQSHSSSSCLLLSLTSNSYL